VVSLSGRRLKKEFSMFDLEKAINQWRKTLNKNGSLEDGYKEELENHLRDKIEYLTGLGFSDKKAFAEAVKKIGGADSLGTEFRKSHTRWMPSLLLNYFKIGLRKLRRQRIYSLINIAGLAVGLACCSIIILYVTNELSYDSYHPDADRIYRVAVHQINIVGEFSMALSRGPLGPELRANYPQVEEAVRIVPPYENADHVLAVQGEKRFFENRVYFVDPKIFGVFHIPFNYGNPVKALVNPNTVVITEEMALKYFDERAPLGKTLRIELDYDTGSVALEDFEVTGIVKNSPPNTHLKFDMLVSMSTMIQNLPDFSEDWINPKPKYTYVKLVRQTDAVEFERQIQTTAQKYVETYEKERNRPIQLYEYFLQPISRIHMYSHIMREIEPPGNWYYVSIYSIIAFLILLIGCMNFMNLSAALSTTRTKEVGLRKVVGAQRRQLVWQFLGEAFLVTFLAFIVAFGLILFLLIPFNQMAGTALSLDGLKQPVVLVSLLGLLLFVAVGAGSYPAFILTKSKPISVLHGNLAPSSRGSRVQKLLVVSQFAISIFLVICTLTVFRQLSFMKGGALGFDMEQKILLPVKSNMNHLRRDYENIKADFLRIPDVAGATVSSRVPGDRDIGGYYLSTKGIDMTGAQWVNVITTDYDFIEEYGIQMAAGRAFDRALGTDENEAFIINLAGVKALGFSSPQEAIGKSFTAHYNRLTKTIVGVTEDFHVRGMQEVVEPLVLDIENSLFDTITLSVRVDNMKELLSSIEDTWNTHFPGVPFAYSFLDENFGREYLYEEQMGRLLGLITTMGFIIACLGLFGLASFVAHYRKKEIGIRKVLGASVQDIVSLLSKDFILLVVVSILVASPIAWYSINRWLQGFAYRIDFSFVVFFIAAAGALAIALVTVSLHGIRAALSNPVNSLRDE
jgi:putative ABC transport system permease protein